MACRVVGVRKVPNHSSVSYGSSTAKCAIAFTMLILSGCNSNSPKHSDEVCFSRETYKGVVLALATGTATFATNRPYCAYVIVGNDELYDRIFEAWRASPYGGDLRPIYLSIEGKIVPQDDPAKAPYFKVYTVNEISTRFTKEQAKAAFRLRINLPLPNRRTDGEEEQPHERTILTD